MVTCPEVGHISSVYAYFLIFNSLCVHCIYQHAVEKMKDIRHPQLSGDEQLQIVLAAIFPPLPGNESYPAFSV
jgi:hypothetical protein